MDIIDRIYKALYECNIDLAIENFCVEHNDMITNGVREKLDKLPEEKIIEIKDFLNSMLDLCYEGKIENHPDAVPMPLPDILGDKLFLFKETVIYFLGRLSIKPDIEKLKKAYYMEENKHIKLNLVFASLATFDEEIEMDFVRKCSLGSEYDKMIRSWTMAYFTMAEKPYEFDDMEGIDWTKAKLPRIKRLAINDESNSKYMKAMSFRLMDLLVLYLFINNRNDKLNEEEKEVVENSNIEYDKYSSDKKILMKKFKSDILSK